MGLKESFGRNININHEIRERYNHIQSGFLFKGEDNKGVDYKYLFMMCLGLAYTQKCSPKTVKNPVGLLNISSFSEDDLWTIASIAVETTGDIRIIGKAAEMRKIATEYAHAGLDVLEDLIAEYGSGENLELVLEKIGKDSLSM
ncbi:hypothetical protein [Methanococcoides seepicolus]|uniref:Dnd system-associated protein 4 n=1 Tax=Methanococcoides seepicolus TaxID=2828780 RepID=A0A9E4ZFA1_9EURY|nr:hypothetical protein [Methanococcoides seepicolus]MCM1986820.1 hypothetical protein [Methanococcoides seepicolus]